MPSVTSLCENFSQRDRTLIKALGVKSSSGVKRLCSKYTAHDMRRLGLGLARNDVITPESATFDDTRGLSAKLNTFEHYEALVQDPGTTKLNLT